ncbi:MAG: DUF1127 domain-containing protein [Pseudomonadota bacterium]
MANITTQAPITAPFGLVQRVFSWLGGALMHVAETNQRVRQAEALMALSDAELAARGLKREDIARHVFSDSYWM